VGRRREVALTFDDGPGPFTLPILAILHRLHAKATFFEIGRQVLTFPRITARQAREGMAIGDHTQDHPPLALLSPEEQAAQIDEAAHAIRTASAPRPLLFRPPYGSFDRATLHLLHTRDMLMVLWTVDTSDYSQPGVRRIVYTALSGVRPGAIILFHDGGGNRRQTVAALPRIIERLHERGYRLVTIPQLLRDDPPPASQPRPENLIGD
jgi:peptidoglycan/xylan/chitin deacetylase (PgdA/CDA1 family)